MVRRADERKMVYTFVSVVIYMRDGAKRMREGDATLDRSSAFINFVTGESVRNSPFLRPYWEIVFEN